MAEGRVVRSRTVVATNKVFKSEAASQVNQRRRITTLQKSVSAVSVSKPHLKLKTSPYEKFTRELNIVLPTPNEKFMEFMQIAPFNRASNHLQMITHFLYRYAFFKLHPSELIENFAKKIVLVSPEEVNEKLLLVVSQGECYYHNKLYKEGAVLGRKDLKPERLVRNDSCQFIGINRHEYMSFLSNYLNAQRPIFKEFLQAIQVLKVFPEKALQKFVGNLSIQFLTKGEDLYYPGEETKELLVLYRGKATRKIIVEIDKINKIPLQKYQKIVKVMSRSYQHKIEFEREDLVGVCDIIENLYERKELVTAETDCIIIGIDRTNIEENLDDYIVDRLKKYHRKKYPVNYDELCENYLKRKTEMRKIEQRKILALANCISANMPEKKTKRIEEIMKAYEDKIKCNEKEHLLGNKLSQRLIKSD